MKKYVWVAILCVMLAGCREKPVMETVSDSLVEPVMARPMQIRVELPGETALPVMENDSSRLYLCEDYEILLQTLDGGDLNKTVRTLSGFSREELTVLETDRDGYPCLEFVWASAAEGSDRIGRSLILDDGSYHYCMTVLWNAEEENSHINWNQVFSSFSVV